MRLLLLHLSDLHISDYERDLTKLEKIDDAINVLGFIDECIVVCSGDITNRGAINEFKSARYFFGALISRLSKKVNGKFVNFLLVPGNHDITYPKNPRNSDDIQNYYRDQIVDTKLENELAMLNNFFDYATIKKNFVKNQLCDVRYIDLFDYRIQVNLLNTAPFSTLKKDNKELHYLPENELYKLQKDNNADLAITIMHHSSEWFHWDIKEYLESILFSNTDIVFQGHEHFVASVSINRFPDNLLISKGGEYSGKFSEESSFSAITLNTVSNEYSEYQFFWKPKQLIFLHECLKESEVIIPKTRRLLPNKNFLTRFYMDNQGICDNILLYFVFPKLSLKTNTELDDGDIIKPTLSQSEFLNKIKTQKATYVNGKSRSGKTTLCKWVYNALSNEGITPLYLGSDDYRPKRLNKIIQDIFEEQYSEKSLQYRRYEQQDVSQKYLIIDDFHLIQHGPNRLKLISFLGEFIGHIIVFFNSNFNLSVEARVSERLGMENIDEIFDIQDFYKSKRTELIDKICNLNKNNNNIDIASINVNVDKLVQRRYGLFELSPEFIIQYVKFFIENKNTYSQGEEVVNIIFETNIRNAIINNVMQQNEVSECLIALEEIAYYMHFHESDRVKYVDINRLIDDYNREYLLNINAKRFMDTVYDAKIMITRDNNTYVFSNRNYMAYFVAKKISKLIDKTGNDLEPIRTIIQNICFGINDTVLLFLSFIRNSTKFTMSMCDKVDQLLGEYIQLDFDKNNIPFIKQLKLEPFRMPDKEEKSELSEAVGGIEEISREHDAAIIEYKGIYDYDKDLIEKKEYAIIQAQKLLEMVSRSLVSLFDILDAQQKTRIRNLIYEGPNRILYAFFEPYRDNIDDHVQAMYNDISSSDNNVTKEEIKDLFTIFSAAMCLSVYESIAFTSSSPKSFSILQKYKMISSNHKLINLLMKERASSSEEFINHIIIEYKKANDTFIKQLLLWICKKHLMTYEVKDHRLIDQLTQSMFPRKDKKKLIMMAAQPNESS